MECKSLKELLSAIAADLSRRRKTKREASHDLAHGFCRMIEEKHRIPIIEPNSKSANYFCAKIAGKPVWISPFASHEGWWEKPSEGLREKVRDCDAWGVVHFQLTSTEQRCFWTEGTDFKEHVLKGQKVHLSDLRTTFTKEFSNEEEFLELVKTAMKRGTGKLLLKKAKPV